MQKKLIALAVAGMVAAPLAMAQSNVTIYGIADVGFTYGSSHSGIYDPVTDSVGNKAKSRTGLDSGRRGGSRIGFRGTEDLGNGMKAMFVIEQGFTIDTSSVPNTDRQSFLGLSGDFGTVTGGLQWSPQHLMLFRLDPFGIGNHPSAAQTYARNTNLQNTLAYTSPTFNGLNVVVAHSFNATGTELAKKDGNAKVWAISPRYANGPIDVQLNWHRIKSDAPSTDATKVWDLGGSYDFGVAKLAAMYGVRKQSDTIDSRSWFVAATIPVSEAGAVKVSYNHNREKELDVKATQWVLGYDHKLSARTTLYAVYGKGSSDFGLYNPTTAVVSTTGAYKSNFNFGINHAF